MFWFVLCLQVPYSGGGCRAVPPWFPFGRGLIPAADSAPGGHPSAVGHPRRLAPLSLATLSKVMLPSGNRPQPNTDWPRDVNAWLSPTPPTPRQIYRLISSSESLLPQLRPPLSQLSSLCLILLPAQIFSLSSVDPKSMPSELASCKRASQQLLLGEPNLWSKRIFQTHWSTRF